MKLFDRWKEEWWARKQGDLVKTYREKTENLEKELGEFLQTAKDDFSKRLKNLAKEHQVEIENKQKDIHEITRRLEEKKLELLRANEDLKNQIRTIEAKASPSNVWAEAFTAGFSKAWDMMLPIMSEGLEKTKKTIEDKAISQTLERLSNGNYKKTH